MAAWFYLTSSRFGPNYSKTLFDYDKGPRSSCTWTASADVCDEDQGTDDALWRIAGVLPAGASCRDTLEEIMKHCFGYLWAFGGRVYAALDTTKTADATLTEDDFLDRGMFTWSRLPSRQRVNRCHAWFTDPVNSYSDSSREYRASTVTANNIHETQERLSLCTSASVAQRWSKQRVLKDQNETIIGKGEGHPEHLLNRGPGDRIDITATGLSGQAFRLLEPTYRTERGTIEFNVREYSADAIVSGASDENDPYDFEAYDPPDPPTAASKVLDMYGDWDGKNSLPDSDDIDTTDWTYTNFSYSTTSGSGYTFTVMQSALLYTTTGSAVRDITSDLGSTTKFVLHAYTFLVQGTPSQDRDWYLEYLEDSVVIKAYKVGETALGPGGDGWSRIVDIIDIDTGATTYELRFRATAGAKSGLWDNLHVRRMMVVPYEFTPALGLEDKWTWTEDASASDTVSYYQWGYSNDAGLFVPVKQVPVGYNQINVPVYHNGSLLEYGPFDIINFTKTMKALGKDGSLADFPAVSSTFPDVWIGTEGETLALASTELSDSSTIDADTVDSLHAASFLRSDASDNLTSGTLTTNAGTTLDVNGAAALDGATSLSLPTSSITGAGTGSGLDADKLDNIEGSSFLRSDATDSYSGGVLTLGGELVFGAESELTISSGVITIIATYHTVDTEGDAASDDLRTISGMQTGQWAIIRPINDARTIVLKHYVSGADNILCQGSTDITLDTVHKWVILFNFGAAVHAVMFDCSL